MGMFTTEKVNPDGADALPKDTPRPLVASYTRLKISDPNAQARLVESPEDREWQRRAWQAYEDIGEVHFAYNLIGNLMSRMRIYVGGCVCHENIEDMKDLTPGIKGAAEDALRKLHAHEGGLGAALRAMAINLSVPGECYLVQIPAREVATPTGTRIVPERWEIRSIDEVIVPKPGSNEPFRVTNTGATGATTAKNSPDIITLPPDAFVARMWRRSPRFSGRADSSMRPVLALCDELRLINQTFQATARSRLNSGLLFVPDTLAASTPGLLPGATGEDASSADVDDFEENLIEGMMTPIQDPSSASAVVPILVRGPAEAGEKIKLIQFDRTFDPSLVQRADRVLERILQGLDLPKDMISGLANVRYSNAITIEDTLFKAHLEPLALLICDLLTYVYLRPALEARGYTEQQAHRLNLWYDPSVVVMRPNRNADAVALYDRYALSGEALREANGFTDGDGPTPTEVLLRMLVQKGPMGPELSESLMRYLAPMVMQAATEATLDTDEATGLPPAVQQLLDSSAAAPTVAPATPEPEEEATAEPTPEPVDLTEQTVPDTTDAARAANTSGPRAGRPAAPASGNPPLLPPRPQQ